MIHKNSNIAGTVLLTTNDYDNSTNNYYILPNKQFINKDTLFILLKFFENKFKDLSKINNTINLSRNKLDNFDIPILSNYQQTLLLKSFEFDNKINTFMNINDNIHNIMYI
jgi:hypothetical protein